MPRGLPVHKYLDARTNRGSNLSALAHMTKGLMRSTQAQPRQILPACCKEGEALLCRCDERVNALYATCHQGLLAPEVTGMRMLPIFRVTVSLRLICREAAVCRDVQRGAFSSLANMPIFRCVFKSNNSSVLCVLCVVGYFLRAVDTHHHEACGNLFVQPCPLLIC
jgi:hypothetical protein